MEADDESRLPTVIEDEFERKGGEEGMSSELLDMEVYASSYGGRTKINRLLFIAERCDSEEMKMELLRIAYDEAKKGLDTDLFREIVERIDGKLGNKYSLDQEWVDKVNWDAYLTKDMLKNVLRESKASFTKESIRMGYNDLGDFYYSHGQLANAFKKYARSRGFCATSEHILQMCMKAILACIEMGHFYDVGTYVAKAEQISNALKPVDIAKLHCASGLAHLEHNQYKLAAQEFLATSPELGNSYSDVITPEDIATYGGLCALASFDSTEFQYKVLRNLSFESFLELVPGIKAIINDFCSSHYASCFEHLETLKASVLLLDIHLHDHIEILYSQIRERAIVQYTHPSLPIDLSMMADTFKTDISGLQSELETLISDKKIKAQIDSNNNILYLNDSPLKSAAAAASARANQAQKEVYKYVKAISAFDAMEKCVRLESVIKEREDQLMDVDVLLKGKSTLRAKQIVNLQGQRDCLVSSLKSVEEDLKMFERAARLGIRGKTKEELTCLLESAKTEANIADQAMRRAKKDYANSLKLKCKTKAQFLSENGQDTKIEGRKN